ncbi:MAG: UvrD-helicase domain-containing protein [Thermoguttaceae bacterium]
MGVRPRPAHRRDWQDGSLADTGMSPTTFTPSPGQQRVSDDRGSHLKVIACTGAGKTEAISRRVASLIDEGIEPFQIIAFTFTERAAANGCLFLSRQIVRREKNERRSDKGPTC